MKDSAAQPGKTVPDSRELDRSLTRGLAWSGGAKWGSQILTWGTTILIARLLEPEHYGIVGMATIYLGLVTLLNEFGMGSAIVTLRDLEPRQVAQLNSVAAGFGALTFLVSLAVAPALARFFDTPELRDVLVVMSTAFVLGAFRTVPQGLLSRELRFPLLAGIEAAQSLLRSALMLALAFAGFGYWALAVGYVVGAGIWTALTLAVRRYGFAMVRWSDLARALTFSWQVLVGRLGWYVYSHADFAVAGRVLGAVPLGFYSLGWTLAGLPVDKITALITGVVPAYFAAVQSDSAALRRYLLRLTEGLSLVTFPMTIGLALVADVAVPLLLGEKWSGAVAPLQILAGYASFRSISPLVSQVLVATRQTRFGMWNSVAAAVLLPLGFYVASRWGVVGLAWSWVLLHPIVTLTVYWRVFTRIGLSVSSYVRAIWPAASSAVAMVLAVLWVKSIETGEWPLIARLLAEVAVGCVAYCTVVEFVHRRGVSSVREVLGLLRS